MILDLILISENKNFQVLSKCLMPAPSNSNTIMLNVPAAVTLLCCYSSLLNFWGLNILSYYCPGYWVGEFKYLNQCYTALAGGI